MTATALVPVFTGTLADRTTQLCDARALHAFMQVKRDFTTWIKGRIRKFGFVQDADYLLTQSGVQVLTKSGENLGGRPSTEYHLTLDMAKELAMVENNEQGRAARRYFIECERQAMAARPANPALDYDRISPAQAQDLKELVHSVVDAKVQGFAETWARLHRKFRVNSYLELPATRFDEARDYLLGKLPEEAPKPALPGQPDASRMQAILGASLDAGARVQQAVAQGMLAGGGEEWSYQRWILAFSHDAQAGAVPYLRQMEQGAFVATWPRLVKDVASGECMCTSAELLEMAVACMHRLQQRGPARQVLTA